MKQTPESVPIGYMDQWVGDDIPEGWTVAHPRLMSVDLYPELFAKLQVPIINIGKRQYFRLPDMGTMTILQLPMGGEVFDMQNSLRINTIIKIK